MVISIPPIHMTARALEWLEKATTIYGWGKHYVAPINEAACDMFHPDRMLAPHIMVAKGTIWKYKGGDTWEVPAGSVQTSEHWRPKLLKEWTCGVEDIRSLWLGAYVPEFIDPEHGYTVQFGPSHHGGHWYKGTAPKLPTCQECLVLMDKANETAPMKYGQFLQYHHTNIYKEVGTGIKKVHDWKGLRWTMHPQLTLPCRACKGVGHVPSVGLYEKLGGDVNCYVCKGSGHDPSNYVQTTNGFRARLPEAKYAVDDDMADAMKYVMDSVPEWGKDKL